MATTKNFSATMQYQNNATSPTAVTLTVEAEVSGSDLVAGHRIIRPGVFTAGTPSEGYGSNLRESSNG